MFKQKLSNNIHGVSVPLWQTLKAGFLDQNIKKFMSANAFFQSCFFFLKKTLKNQLNTFRKYFHLLNTYVVIQNLPIIL